MNTPEPTPLPLRFRDPAEVEAAIAERADQLRLDLEWDAAYRQGVEDGIALAFSQPWWKRLLGRYPLPVEEPEL